MSIKRIGCLQPDGFHLSLEHANDQPPLSGPGGMLVQAWPLRHGHSRSQHLRAAGASYRRPQRRECVAVGYPGSKGERRCFEWSCDETWNWKTLQFWMTMLMGLGFGLPG